MKMTSKATASVVICSFVLLIASSVAQAKGCRKGGTKTVVGNSAGRIYFEQERKTSRGKKVKSVKQFYACSNRAGKPRYLGFAAGDDDAVYKVNPIQITSRYALYENFVSGGGSGGTNVLRRIDLDSGKKLQVRKSSVTNGEAKRQALVATMDDSGNVFWAEKVLHQSDRDDLTDFAGSYSIQMNWLSEKTGKPLGQATYLAARNPFYRAKDYPTVGYLKTKLDLKATKLKLTKLSGGKVTLAWQINGVAQSATVQTAVTKPPTACGTTAEGKTTVVYLDNDTVLKGEYQSGYSYCLKGGNSDVSLVPGCGQGTAIHQALVNGQTLAYICTEATTSEAAGSTDKFSVYRVDLTTGSQKLAFTKIANRCTLILPPNGTPACAV